MRGTLLEDLRRVQDDGKTGTLLLIRDTRRITVHYRRGLIEAVSSGVEPHRLGEYLVREGFLQNAELQSLLALGRRRKLALGEMALKREMLDATELTDVVRRQALFLLQFAVENGFSASTFTVGAANLVAPAQIPFPHLMLEILRNTAGVMRIADGKFITLFAGKELLNLPWLPTELLILSHLKGPTTLPQLMASTELTESGIGKVLHVLNGFGFLEVLDAAQANVRITASSTTALASRSLSSPFEHLVPVVSSPITSEKMEVFRNSGSIASEQFKTLKIRINAADIENPVKVITMSSPCVEDGKSLVSANLSLSYSLDPGRRTIIVDCDMRRPSVHKYLGVSLGPGLSEYLSNGHLQPYCYMRRFRNLYFMTAGEIPENPVELLSSERMRTLIDYLKTQFETIVLDAPPVGPVSDARIVTALSDGLIMVVRSGKTGAGSVESAFKNIDREKLIGVVFNDAQPQRFQSSYSNGYYSQGYAKWYRKSNVRRVVVGPKNYYESGV